MVKVRGLAMTFRMGSKHWVLASERPPGLGTPARIFGGEAWGCSEVSQGLCKPWAWLSHVPTTQMDSLTPGSRMAGSLCGPGTQASSLLGHQG